MSLHIWGCSLSLPSTREDCALVMVSPLAPGGQMTYGLELPQLSPA